MIVCRKAYFLKDDIDAKELGKFGFETLNNGGSYHKDLDSKWLFDRISWYEESRIFKRKTSFSYWTIKVRKYIKDLIDAGLVYQKKYYYYIAWDSRKWSDKKIKRVEDKINKLQERADKKFKGE